MLCVRLRVEAVQWEKPRRPRENSGVCSQWGFLSEEQRPIYKFLETRVSRAEDDAPDLLQVPEGPVPLAGGR